MKVQKISKMLSIKGKILKKDKFPTKGNISKFNDGKGFPKSQMIYCLCLNSEYKRVFMVQISCCPLLQVSTLLRNQSGLMKVLMFLIHHFYFIFLSLKVEYLNGLSWVFSPLIDNLVGFIFYPFFEKDEWTG